MRLFDGSYYAAFNNAFNARILAGITEPLVIARQWPTLAPPPELAEQLPIVSPPPALQPR
jgi:hypothetical protein